MNKILVCLDFTDITEAVIEEAIRFAKATEADIELAYVSQVHTEKVTHVVSSENQKRLSLILTKENKRMESYESDIRKAGVQCDSSILQGNVSDVLAEKAKTIGADYIIIGSRTTNAATHIIKGSVGADLLKKLKKPLLLVPAGD